MAELRSMYYYHSGDRNKAFVRDHRVHQKLNLYGDVKAAVKSSCTTHVFTLVRTRRSASTRLASLSAGAGSHAVEGTFGPRLKV